MPFSQPRHITRWTLQIWTQNDPLKSGIRVGAPFFQTHQRAYSFLTTHFRNALNCKVSSRFSHLNSRCFSSSSSSSSDGKIGFLKWYLGMLEIHPFVTKSVSSSIIFTAADVTSQMITLQPSGTYDSMRTLRIAGYGLLIMGPSQHLWFNCLSKILPQRDVLTTFKQILMGQLLYGPCMNSIFFSYNAALRVYWMQVVYHTDRLLAH